MRGGRSGFADGLQSAGNSGWWPTFMLCNLHTGIFPAGPLGKSGLRALIPPKRESRYAFATARIVFRGAESLSQDRFSAVH